MKFKYDKILNDIEMIYNFLNNFLKLKIFFFILIFFFLLKNYE